jgi:hypothetical protein
MVSIDSNQDREDTVESAEPATQFASGAAAASGIQRLLMTSRTAQRAWRSVFILFSGYGSSDYVTCGWDTIRCRSDKSLRPATPA